VKGRTKSLFFRRPAPEPAPERLHIPKATNWLWSDEDGHFVAFNLDQMIGAMLPANPEEIVLTALGGVQMVVSGTTAQNLRAHLELVGVNIEHAAEIRDASRPPRTDAPDLALGSSSSPAPEIERVGVCRVCGCTNDTPCTNPDGDLCHWVNDEEDLCSACAEEWEYRMRTTPANSVDRWSCPWGAIVADNCSTFPRCHVCAFRPDDDLPGNWVIHIDRDRLKKSEVQLSYNDRLHDRFAFLSLRADVNGDWFAGSFASVRDMIGNVPKELIGEPIFDGLLLVRPGKPGEL